MVALILGLLAYVVLLCIVSAYAIVRGGTDERRTATALLIASAASQVATAFGPHFNGPEYPLMAVDAAFFVFLAREAVRSTRFWLIWAAASQLNGTLTHLAPVLHPGLPMRVYASTQPVWAFPILLAITAGVWRRKGAPTR